MLLEGLEGQWTTGNATNSHKRSAKWRALNDWSDKTTMSSPRLIKSLEDSHRCPIGVRQKGISNCKCVKMRWRRSSDEVSRRRTLPCGVRVECVEGRAIHAWRMHTRWGIRSRAVLFKRAGHLKKQQKCNEFGNVHNSFSRRGTQVLICACNDPQPSMGLGVYRRHPGSTEGLTHELDGFRFKQGGVFGVNLCGLQQRCLAQFGEGHTLQNRQCSGSLESRQCLRQAWQRRSEAMSRL